VADQMEPVAEDEGQLPGLLFGLFNYAVEQELITVNPCLRTAPRRASLIPDPSRLIGAA